MSSSARASCALFARESVSCSLATMSLGFLRGGSKPFLRSRFRQFLHDLACSACACRASLSALKSLHFSAGSAFLLVTTAASTAAMASFVHFLVSHPFLSIPPIFFTHMSSAESPVTVIVSGLAPLASRASIALLCLRPAAYRSGVCPLSVGALTSAPSLTNISMSCSESLSCAAMCMADLFIVFASCTTRFMSEAS